MTKGKGIEVHWLVIHSTDDLDWEIEHPASCEWSTPESDPLAHHVCAVGEEVSNAGLDSLDGWEKLSPGRYEVRHWWRRYNTEYGPEFDAGLEIIPRGPATFIDMQGQVEL